MQEDFEGILERGIHYIMAWAHMPIITSFIKWKRRSTSFFHLS